EQDEDDDDDEEEHPASADSIPPPPALLVAAAARPIEGRRADYGFVDSVEAEIRRRRSEDIGYGVNTRVTELAAVQEQDTQDIYGVMEDTQGGQTEIFHRVEALVDDRQYHYETSRLVDQEARFSREAWAHSMGLGSAVHFELQGYMTHAWLQDQRIDAHDTMIATLTTQLCSLQGHLATALGEIRALQAREQARAGAPEGADVIFSCDLKKMAPKKAAPKRTTRLNPGATPNPNSTPSTTTITVTNAQLQAMIDQGVNTALAARDANRTGDDIHTSGTAHDANRTGDDNNTSGTGVRRTERVTRECTYQDFMKCQPLYFKGTEGVVELTQWFERMEMVFRISNCFAENQVKFATCTLLAGALTWWNSHVRIIRNDDAYVMTWIELKKKMADKYCP
nr:hypothetical protein [Tanacetum cinerariifolium]